MSGDPKERAAARKELARKFRKEAYQRAKAQRAKDPKFIAMKEAMKERQKAAYQEAKARRKSRTAEVNAKVEEQRTEKRAIADQALMALVRGGSKNSYDVN